MISFSVLRIRNHSSFMTSNGFAISCHIFVKVSCSFCEKITEVSKKVLLVKLSFGESVSPLFLANVFPIYTRKKHRIVR